MMSTFPTALDVFPVIDETTNEMLTPAAEHDVVHQAVHEALQNVQAFIGTADGAVAGSLVAVAIDHETRIDDAETDIADHESRIDDVETGVTDHETRIAAIEAAPGGGGAGVVETIVAGTGISVDATDPANPIVSAAGGGSLPSGAVDGDLLRTDGGVAGWGQHIEPRRETYLFEDMIGGYTLRAVANVAPGWQPGAPGVVAVTIGGTASMQTRAGACGILRASGVSGGNGTRITVSGIPNIRLGDGPIELNFRVSVSALSDASNDYEVLFGLFDAVLGAVNDGIYVGYRHSTNSGKFWLRTGKAGAFTTVDSGVTVAASTWYRIKLTVNAAGTEVTLAVDNSSPVSNTTNVPLTTTPLGIATYMTKVNGSSQRDLDHDYIEFRQRFTTLR